MRGLESHARRATLPRNLPGGETMNFQEIEVRVDVIIKREARRFQSWASVAGIQLSSLDPATCSFLYRLFRVELEIDKAVVHSLLEFPRVPVSPIPDNAPSATDEARPNPPESPVTGGGSRYSTSDHRKNKPQASASAKGPNGERAGMVSL
jgi:hypothetical protein